MSRLRTFVAVPIEKSTRARAAALQETLARAGADIKWVESKNLHITLLFLGEVEDKQLPAVCNVVADVVGRNAPFGMSVEGAGCFGNPRRPRTLWVGVGAGLEELKALHDALEPPLMDLGCYRREERPYTPHLTLGRVKGEDAGDELAKALARQSAWKGGQGDVREIHVMSSVLGPTGPDYMVLSRAKLGG